MPSGSAPCGLAVAAAATGAPGQPKAGLVACSVGVAVRATGAGASRGCKCGLVPLLGDIVVGGVALAAANDGAGAEQREQAETGGTGDRQDVVADRGRRRLDRRGSGRRDLGRDRNGRGERRRYWHGGFDGRGRRGGCDWCSGRRRAVRAGRATFAVRRGVTRAALARAWCVAAFVVVVAVAAGASGSLAGSAVVSLTTGVAGSGASGSTTGTGVSTTGCASAGVLREQVG